MKKRILSACLAVVLCFTALAGCNKDGNDNTKNGETVEKTQILTNVFKGTKNSLPDGYYIQSGVAPYYDSESGSLTILCSHNYESEEKDENGYSKYVHETILVTFASDGTISEEKKLELGENVYVNNGVLNGGKLYFSTNEYDPETGKESFFMSVYDIETGESAASDELSGMFSPSDRGWFYINNIALDGDGCVYLNSDNELLVLSAELEKLFTVKVQNWIDRMVTSGDGSVYVSTYIDGAQKFVPIDKTKQDFGTSIGLPDTINAHEFFFGGGYDIFYIDRESNGLFGYNFPAEGETAAESGEMVMDFASSDLYANNIEIARIIDTDSIVLYEQDQVTYNRNLMIYERSADIDLSQVKVLEIAYTSSDYSLASSIIGFNKANDGVRIVARDYGVYNNEENPTGGEQRLLNDMLNGLYKPDLITSSGYSYDNVITQVYKNGLYADLYRFIDTSDNVKRDDILGCIKRTFGTSDGKLWAIAPNVSVSTLIGPKSVLGERDGWTLGEMIDFAESLPDDVLLMERLTRESAMYNLLGSNGYGLFIDLENNSCNFESDDFVRYLKYLETLPSTADEINAEYQLDYDQMYKLYHNGKIALRSGHYSHITDVVSEEAKFDTKDVVRIGYPSKDGTSAYIPINATPYIITSFCEYPDEAWSFIEGIIAPEVTGERYGRSGYSSLKSRLNETFEEYYTYFFDVDINGSGLSWGPYDPERDNEGTSGNSVVMAGPDGIVFEEERRSYRKFFTEDDAAALLDWLDNKVGCPIAENIDAKITEIVITEINEFLGGVRTAEDCAAMIQSRVSLWLAEHE